MAAVDEEIFDLELDEDIPLPDLGNENKPLDVDDDVIELDENNFVDEEPELSNANQKEVGEQQETIELCGENVNPDTMKLGPADFELRTVIGEGGYGKVYMVRKIAGRDFNKYFAMKVLKKASLIRNQKDAAHTRSERKVLEAVRHPFIVDLVYAFQTQEKLYLILEYMCGGELFSILVRETILLEDATCFYACEIVLALGHLHKLGVIYRDLKPENILLDAEGHIKLTDFGLCKEQIQEDNVTHTFCGTLEYMAPEIITRRGHGKAVDWWSLGALIFEMLVGQPPFIGDCRPSKVRAILRAGLVMPDFVKPEAKDLVRRLLKRQVPKRLGSCHRDALAIQSHSFFRDVNWDDVLAKRLKPPFDPQVRGANDFSNFDKSFTKQDPVDLPVNSPLSGNINFEGFSYEAPSYIEERRLANLQLARSPLRTPLRQQHGQGTSRSQFQHSPKAMGASATPPHLQTFAAPNPSPQND